MRDILLNKTTESQLRAYLNYPSHGLLLQGGNGSGKSTLLEWCASELLHIDKLKLDSYPYLLKLMPDDKGLISIDSVREIDHFVSRAIPGDSHGLKRLVLIDDAENLSIDAQNAILKNLEEPPVDTAYLLTTSNPSKLLATVRSRLTLIRLINPTPDQLRSFLIDQGASETETNTALRISGGRIGLASALALSSQDHPLVRAAETAKHILTSDTYERLLMVNSLQKEPTVAKNTLLVLEQMALIALQTASGGQSKRWQRILTSSYAAERSLEKKTNLRLTLTRLVLNI